MKVLYAVKYTSKRKKPSPDIFGEWELLNSFIVGESLFSNKEDARSFMKEAFPYFIEHSIPSETVNQTEDEIEIEGKPDGIIIKKRVEVQALYAGLVSRMKKRKQK